VLVKIVSILYIATSLRANQVFEREDSMPAKVDTEKCTGCESCVEACPSEAIKMQDQKAVVDAETCIDCAVCVDECPVGAITVE
jgi:NAD-dependent dihydropyrimidine dehydrogenase PreA subunit